MNRTFLVLLSFAGLQGLAAASVFTVGGFTWDSDNAVTTAAFTEGGPGSIFASSFPEGTRSVGNLLNGTNPGFVDITNTITNSGRHTLNMSWAGAANGALVANGAGNDLVIYEVGSITAPEAYVISVRNAENSTFTPYYYFQADSFDASASSFATAIDLSNFGPGINYIDQVSIRAVFNSAAASGGDRVDLAGGTGEGLVAFDVGVGNNLNRVLEPGPQGTAGEYAASRLDADIVYVVSLANTTIPEPSSALVCAGLGLATMLRRRKGRAGV